MTILQFIQNRLQRRPTEGGYIAQIDGLRFIAIFAVVLQHLSERMLRLSTHPIEKDDFTFFISRGTIGVFLFFAISGFVLALPFANSRPLSIARLKAFYLRRLERIEPPYLIWMSFFALVLVMKGAYSLSEILPHWFASVSYTHFLFFNDYSIINPVAWSLEIEIQFYLIAPFLATAYFGISNKTVRRVSIVVVALAFIIVEYSLGWLSFPMKATLLGRLPNFLVGFLMADFYLNEWVSAQRGEHGRVFNKSFLWDVIAVVSFILMCYTWTEELVKTLFFNILMTLFFVSAFKSRLFSQFLSKKWIAITGGMCYTIYLMHLPLLEGFMRLTTSFAISSVYGVNLLVQSLLVLPFVCLSAIVFFLLFEKPFMVKQWYKNIQLSLFLSGLAGVKKKITTLFFFIVVTTTAQAQYNDTTEIKTLKLRPLSILVELAIQNAPQIKVNQIESARQNLTWKVQKGSLADIFTMSGAAVYGNGSAIDANSSGSSTTYILSGRQNLNFNVSLGVRLSGSDFTNRGKKAEILRLQIDQIEQNKILTERQITEQVSILYTQLELAMKILKLKTDALENQRVILTVAEKFFKEGKYQPSEFSTVLTKVDEAEELYEKARSETKKLILILKNIVGGAVLEN